LLRKALVASVAASFLLATPAYADRSDCKRKLERAYSKHWRQVANRSDKGLLRPDAQGRNIRRWGVRFKGVTFDAVCSELRRSLGQLKRLLKSPPYSYSRAGRPRQPPAGVMSDYTESVGGSSNAMVNPYCESRGNPQIVSPNGLYWGWYQFDYATWVAHGGAPSAYGNAPLYVQHQVAARVNYDAWPNC
jgi:Transglycosylase-like domain